MHVSCRVAVQSGGNASIQGPTLASTFAIKQFAVVFAAAAFTWIALFNGVDTKQLSQVNVEADAEHPRIRRCLGAPKADINR